MIKGRDVRKKQNRGSRKDDVSLCKSSAVISALVETEEWGGGSKE